ncbi:sodium:glutamate symporter [Salicibibacter halophilus]|uniref:Sodium:glutamate symporter n=1 Tax=Salicibibacter halophilus TaxID=2502791 RepID=A0A514LLZ7_9BACI|nr:sodium/glutamate symporter [Salicibibacter halophilus]QDI92887.1 sodium:glutamate symporter [Salicibibacter halophilus]
MSIFDLTVDLGLISVLLLIGVWLRARFQFIQKYFIPASMIAGFMALAFGPNGFGWLPFSGSIADYPTILIAIIFGAIPIGAAQVNWKKIFHRVRNMWFYSMTLTLLMWPSGLIITYLVLGHIWDLPSGFGFALGAGFIGGHGTAAAIGDVFNAHGWEEITALAYTSATIGLLCAIVGGLFIIKRNARKNQTAFLSDFNDLPEDLRTGLVKKDHQASAGKETVSPNTVDPLFFHLAIIGVVVVISYYLQESLEALFPQMSVPLLSLAFIVGLIAQMILSKLKANQYVDKPTVNRISGTATDLTVAFGIASINLAIVADYIVPLVALFIFGIVWAYLIFHFISPRVFHQHWFENGIFGWGWSTGTVAMGVALLKVADPKSEATTLDDYALGYAGMVPFEVIIITFGPLLIISGFGVVFTLALLAFWVILFVIAAKSGWLVSEKRVRERRKAL